jgi:hypothetical protein
MLGAAYSETESEGIVPIVRQLSKFIERVENAAQRRLAETILAESNVTGYIMWCNIFLTNAGPGKWSF